MTACPFCKVNTEVVIENEYAFSICDRHPVSRGHSLIIPKKHVTNIFDLPLDEYHACFDLVRAVRKHLEREHRPDGFNIGVNYTDECLNESYKIGAPAPARRILQCLQVRFPGPGEAVRNVIVIA
jgi:diadenosine tetraphosphate (Ap4A) HIT family hydrolase